MVWSAACVFLCLHAALAVKVKVVMHSEEGDSKIEEEEPKTESWVHHKKRPDVTMLPFLKHHKREQREHTEHAEEKMVSYIRGFKMVLEETWVLYNKVEAVF